jgi:hypothetical protein
VADRITFSELIAYRPLVYAWLWELLCVAGVVYLALTGADEMLMVPLILVGATPFGLAVLMFLQARKRKSPAPKTGSIVE